MLSGRVASQGSLTLTSGRSSCDPMRAEQGSCASRSLWHCSANPCQDPLHSLLFFSVRTRLLGASRAQPRIGSPTHWTVGIDDEGSKGRALVDRPTLRGSTGVLLQKHGGGTSCVVKPATYRSVLRTRGACPVQSIHRVRNAWLLRFEAKRFLASRTGQRGRQRQKRL